MQKKNLVLVLFFILMSFCLFAQKQKYTSTHKKAVQYFEKGLDFYYQLKNGNAITQFENAIKSDPQFIEPYLAIGDIYYDEGQLEKAEFYYQQSLEINPGFFPLAWFLVGKINYELKQYEKASDAFKNAIHSPIGHEEKKEVERYISIVDFIIKSKSNPVPFDPVNMGTTINTVFDEYLPYLTSDANVLLFTRRFPKDNVSISPTKEEEDLYIAEKEGDIWQKAERMPEPVHSHGNEGSSCISQDGRLLFFTACDREGGYGSCDIYMCEKMGNQWSKPHNLGKNVNSAAWESQPSLSIDGKTLYFSSNRKGGIGRRDIWKSRLQENGEWSPAVNLGEPINTEFDEVSPFIHYDDQTMYFSSNGHIGMGGFDLFLSKRQNDGSWGTPFNLGYPINTENDESGMVVDATGMNALLASDKLGGYGKHDLYSFTLYPEIRPTLVTYMKGFVFDESSKKPIEANFQIIDMQSSEVIAESKSDKITGQFLISLPLHKTYILNVSSEGYLFFSDHIELTYSNQQAPFLKDIPLKPLQVGESMILRNVFFDVNQYTLKEESKIELNKLTNLLRKYPKLIIEIGGHTDNTGDVKSNIVLSENRAKAVYQFLLEQKIPLSQLQFKGYGQSKPIESNDTDLGRASNRRTECKILNK